MSERYRIKASNAELIRQWIEKRGGVQVWGSLNLSDPSTERLTPLNDADGARVARPHWSCPPEPTRILTRVDEIEVATPKLVKRFHVAVRVGGQGLSLKVSDGGSRRIKAEVAKAGDDAWYEFDYEQQDALIFKPGAVTPLETWTV